MQENNLRETHHMPLAQGTQQHRRQKGDSFTIQYQLSTFIYIALATPKAFPHHKHIMLPILNQ